jgi:(2Fe-2S) ferredoxin
MTLQELDQLKHEILSERFTGQDEKCYRVTVGMGTCGIKAGAARILEELKNTAAANDGIMVAPAGCLGLCSFEPIIEIRSAGGQVYTYGSMTPEKVRKIAAEHILGGRPVEEWIIATREV